MAKTQTDEEKLVWQPACGRRLKLLREILPGNLTGERMADAVDVERSNWVKFENGKLAPNPYKMLAVCARYRVSMDYIYRGLLFGVHPSLVPELVARDPDLWVSTKDILLRMGMDPASYTGPILGLPQT